MSGGRMSWGRWSWGVGVAHTSSRVSPSGGCRSYVSSPWPFRAKSQQHRRRRLQRAYRLQVAARGFRRKRRRRRRRRRTRRHEHASGSLPVPRLPVRARRGHPLWLGGHLGGPATRVAAERGATTAAPCPARRVAAERGATTAAAWCATTAASARAAGAGTAASKKGAGAHSRAEAYP